MSKVLILTKNLLKNDSAGFNKKTIAIVLVLILCFLPLALMFTFATISSYDILAAYNLQDLLLSSVLSGSCLVMIFFGFFYIMSLFYFSNDIETLLSLPLYPYQILTSKLIIIILFEYITEFVTLVPILVGFCYKAGSVFFIIYSIIIFLFLPLLPIILCSLIIMVIMSFSKTAKNKDLFKTISGIVGIAFAILLQVVVNGFNRTGASGNSLAGTLKQNTSVLKNAANIFPTAKIASYSLVNTTTLSGLFNILAFLVISIAALIIFIMAAQGLFLKGALGMSASNSSGKKLSDSQLNKVTIRNSIVKAYTIKELKLLFRTPAYFQNCILGGVIFPIAMFFVLILGKGGLSDLPKFTMNSSFLAIASVVLIAASSFNMICPTSISREGPNYYVMKYIPVPYESQILAKVLSGAIVSEFTSILTLLIGIYLFKITPLMILLIVIISTLGILASSFFGVFIDLKIPNLDWDNEAKAVKQNFNPLILMFPMIVLLIIITVGIGFANLSLVLSFLALLFIFSCFCFLGIRVCLYSGAKTLGGKEYSSSPFKLGKLNIKKSSMRVFVSVALTIVIIAVVGIVLRIEMTSGNKVSLASNNFSIKAGFENYSTNTNGIKTVYLKNTVPSMNKIVGTGTSSIKRGKFKVSGYGTGEVFIESKSGPYLYIITKGNFIIMNYKNSSETKQLYTKLQKYLNK